MSGSKGVLVSYEVTLFTLFQGASLGVPPLLSEQ